MPRINRTVATGTKGVSPDRLAKWQVRTGNQFALPQGQGIEYTVSLIELSKGQLLGEPGQVRPAIVDHHQIGNGMVNNVPSVIVGLKSGQVFRWFSFDKARAEALERDLVAEIPRLKPGPAVQ
jgi:hypothetical protein